MEWDDEDGAVQAAYVFPSGSAFEAGLRRGDLLYELEYQQIFSADDLKRAVEGIPPGQIRTYTVQRDTGLESFDVQISLYPTFLYPLSTALWYASIWAFVFAAFLHSLALIVVMPLATRTRHSRLPGLLILAASLWIIGNLMRLLWLEFVGPPELDGPLFVVAFSILTVTSLVGWIAFPVLLLETARTALFEGSRRWTFRRFWIWMPAILLGSAAVYTAPGHTIGPLSLGSLISPILFYVSCYVAAATGLLVVAGFRTPGGTWSSDDDPTVWGHLIVFVVALLSALFVLDMVPLLGDIKDTTAGWLVVALQLISVAPVGLVSFETLRYGKLDRVLTRAPVYIGIAGLFFFAFTGAMYLLLPYLERFSASGIVVGGFVGVILFITFERLVRWLQPYSETLFASERRRTRQRLDALSNEMRVVLDVQDLAQKAVDAVTEALGARSGLLFLKSTSGQPLWFLATAHPEPPYLTESTLQNIFPHFEEEESMWARNRELNESALPASTVSLLVEYGAALVLPVMGDTAPFGLLILGDKRRRRAVYNLEDLELLRSVCAQLGLALERIHLVERERELIRISAEAQLAALRAQINPHFLFNTLNTIASLVEENPKEAEDTIEHLAEIFRLILQVGSQPFVSLRTELKLVGHYLAIEQARFGDRLHVVESIGPDTLNLQIPAFSAQTIVENAVRHGIAKRRKGGTVTIQARFSASDGDAEIIVTDTGVGIPILFGKSGSDEDSSFFGLGLKNVAQRLERLYERTDLLRIQSNPDHGTTVQIRIPVPSSTTVI